jgi:predicted ATP-dependent endonuclease of OLD family
MRLKTVFIRFYKSFNFDYLRKNHPEAKPKPWETIDTDKWYPYVKVPIEPEITAVVGANESGKSQLLSAIEKGISGEGINRSQDFCRYSPFFKLEQGKLKWPDIGFEWGDLSEQEIQVVSELCELDEEVNIKKFLLFRISKDKINIFIPTDNEYQLYEFEESDIQELLELLPHVFRINANVGLPNSVPIRSLIKQSDIGDSGNLELLNRENRGKLVDSLFRASPHFLGLSNPAHNATSVAAIAAEISPHINNSGSANLSITEKEIELVRNLILKVADIDEEALLELYEALKAGNREGVVMGITQHISVSLAKTLNFPRWWVQDSDFRLHVDARDHDLVFTIVDRTGTHYAFDERSSGLKYFLSYYIQYRAYEPQSSNPEILLMDEPDAYLSSQAQQDLLKIFDAFANPKDDASPVQVIYVTHSPFLINKNHAERIRVLEKGSGEEGTRVVRDASKNHYEPLRSAFGAFVGETTFIGNCNLMVEGLADQILIAGASNYLRLSGSSNLEMLDLNNVTIVPSGSASHIPYLVYLAIGRDIERPAVIVLLDSDTAGNTAKKQLIRGGSNKVSLPNDCVLQVGDLKSDLNGRVSETDVLVEIEDLIPTIICLEAVKRYLRDFCEAPERIISKITLDKIEKEREISETLFKALEKIIIESSNEKYHLDKVGFARSVILVINVLYRSQELSRELTGGLSIFTENFKAILKKLRRMQNLAENRLLEERVFQRVDRVKKRFFQDNPLEKGAKKEEAVLFLEELESKLDASLESGHMRLSIQKIRLDFGLDSDLTAPINNYDNFINEIEKIKYSARINSQEMEAHEWD